MTSSPHPDPETLQSLLERLAPVAGARGMSNAELLTRLNRATVVEATLRAGLHDLRNPLQAIVMSGGMLADGEQDPVRAARLHGFIVEAAERAERIANDLVGVHPDRGPEPPEPVALSEVVSTCVRLQHKPGVSETIIIDVELPAALPPVLGVKASVQHAVLNVLLNMRDALERDGGTVSIKGEQDGEFVQLVVTNDGPEIPHELAERIFEPFFTTKTAAPAAQCHLGLGLPVARELLGALGGSLTLRAPADTTGACFVLRLPAAGP